MAIYKSQDRRLYVMKMFIRKILKMDEKQDMSLSLLNGLLNSMIATVMIMFYALFSGKLELIYMDSGTMFPLAVIASIINAAFSMNFLKLGKWAGLSGKTIPSKKAVFALSSLGTAAFILYFLLAKSIF